MEDASDTVPHFGLQIEHSRAPLIHNYTFAHFGIPWRYTLLDSDAVDQFVATNLHAARFFASAVTMPNKVSMVARTDLVEDDARWIGAINTFYTRLQQGREVTLGAKTDSLGVRDAISYNAPQATSKAQDDPALVYGAEGACRLAVYASHKYFHCSCIYVINRLEVDAKRQSMTANGFEVTLSM